MASATSALATLAPYQPPEGLAPREHLAHAKDFIDRLMKKHTTLQKTVENVKVYGGNKVETLGKIGVATVVSGALGLVNGRYGGEKGYVGTHGIPLDLTVSAVAHFIGFTNMAGEVGSRFVHALGDTALGAGTYRVAFSKGVEMAAHAAAKKAAGAGAAPGPQNGAGAGPRGGTTYPLPNAA